MFGHAEALPDSSQDCESVEELCKDSAGLECQSTMFFIFHLSNDQTVSKTILSPLRLPVPPSRRTLIVAACQALSFVERALGYCAKSIPAAAVTHHPRRLRMHPFAL